MKFNYLIPKIPFVARIAIFAVLAAAGIFIQVFAPNTTDYFLVSIILMAGGALFICAKNFKNKPLDLGFEDWKPASMNEFNRIEQNLKMTKKIKYPVFFKPAIGTVFYVILGIIGFFSLVSDAYGLLIVVVDLAVILFPVSFTGLIKLWTPAELKLKTDRLKVILADAEKLAGSIIITPYIRLDKDKEGRQIPEDIRLMIEPRRKPEDFMGVQVQVAINNGPNGAVPYMYAVFLCKGKGKTYENLSREKFGNMLKEPGGDTEYGFIVIRQETTGGGYHTDNNDCRKLFAIVEEKLAGLSAI